MVFYIVGYMMMALATTIAIIEPNSLTPNEVVASIICGVLWPVFILTRILVKILH